MVLRFKYFYFLILLCFFWHKNALAHDVKIAHLKIVEVEENVSWKITWKLPLTNGKVPHISVWLDHQELISNGNVQLYSEQSAILNLDIQATQLIDRSINIKGLEPLAYSALIQIDWLSGDNSSHIITNSSSIIKVSKQHFSSVIFNYMKLGMFHILKGYDHLLFLIGILLIIKKKKSLLIAVTAFTIAHCITLCIAAFTTIQIPTFVVEILIALSIVLLALEVLHFEFYGKKSLTYQNPWLLTFILGLIHGLGFASSLKNIGLPFRFYLESLLAFNLGIELAQIVFILLLVIGFAAVKKIYKVQTQRINIVLAYGIGSIGSFWTIFRLING